MKTILKSININRLIEDMNVVLHQNNFNKDNLCIMSPVKNFVLKEACFYKFVYITDDIKLSNLIFEIKLNNIVLIKSLNNRYKLCFENNKENKLEISNILNIERLILNKFFPDLNKNRTHYINKMPDMNKILDSLLLKLYTKKTLDLKYNKLNIIVKFSGIWKTSENYGLTYKFSY